MFFFKDKTSFKNSIALEVVVLIWSLTSKFKVCCVLAVCFYLPDAAPPDVSWVPDSLRNTMRDKNLSHDCVRVKPRKELCINPTVWGGLVLFWKTSFLSYRFLFFVIAQTDFQEAMRHCNLPIQVHCVTFFQSGTWPLKKPAVVLFLLSCFFSLFSFGLCMQMSCNWEETTSLNMLRKHTSRVGQKFALDI